MVLDDVQAQAWKAHIDRFAACPRRGAVGELEGSCEVVDPETPGQPVLLREVLECPACVGRRRILVDWRPALIDISMLRMIQ